MASGYPKPLMGGLVVGLLGGLLTVAGCTPRTAGPESRRAQLAQPQVLVLAPVLDLSGSGDFDPLRATDLLASEFLSFPEVAVVPVNLTLAALARRGKATVETPEDAIDLAREFGADATIVVAITEYDPYDPPVVGLVMQWYAAPRAASRGGLDPVSASRQATDPAGLQMAAAAEPGPRWQVQRVFNAASQSILDEVRSFAAQREGQASPYGWRKYVKSQELFLRYCCWAAIQTMLEESRRSGLAAAATDADR